MDQLYDTLKQQPKEVVLYFIYKLMHDGKFNFHELAEMHVKYVEDLLKTNTETLMKTRSDIISLWCGTKKDVGKNLTAIIQKGKDEGWFNPTQEKIDNSKWNK